MGKTVDQLSEDENIFDCAWELQAQRELMASNKFDASILNNIARKCFFFRTAEDKFASAQGSFIGGAVAAGAAFMVGAGWETSRGPGTDCHRKNVLKILGSGVGCQ